MDTVLFGKYLSIVFNNVDLLWVYSNKAAVKTVNLAVLFIILFASEVDRPDQRRQTGSDL